MMPDDHIDEAFKLVCSADTLQFNALVKLSGLNPRYEFRFKNFSEFDFSGAILDGYDFTGACFDGASFRGAKIAGATFGNLLGLLEILREADDFDEFLERQKEEDGNSFQRNIIEWKELEQAMPEFRRYVKKMRFRVDDVEEVMQESISRVLRNTSSDYHPTKDELVGWLCVTARNFNTSQIRKSRREIVGLDLQNQLRHLQSTDGDPESAIEYQEVLEAILKLPNHQALALVSFVGGRSYEETAAELGWPVGLLRSRIDRARSKLRAMVGRTTDDEMRRGAPNRASRRRHLDQLDGERD